MHDDLTLSAYNHRMRGISLSASTRNVFTWKELKGPLSVSFACFLGMVISQLIDYYQPDGWVIVKTSAVISTTVMVMEMGTSEKVYIKTANRILGVLAGVALGMVYAVIEQTMGVYFSLIASPRKSPYDYADDWIFILFRIGLLVPTILVAALMMKAKAEYSYGLTTFACHVAAAFLARSISIAISIAAGAILAVTTCIISLFLFELLSTENLILDTNKDSIFGILSVVQLAIVADPESVVTFEVHCDSVHKSISQTESAIETHEKWKRWTLRKTEFDYRPLIKFSRPLYYQAYSLYWGNVSAYHASEYKSEILFCNQEEMYATTFKPLINEMVFHIENIKAKIVLLYANRIKDKATMFDDLILTDLWNGLFRIQEQMKREYLVNRKLFFNSVSQRWNIVDYLRQVAMMTLGIVDYTGAMLAVLVDDKETRERLNTKLHELYLGLDELRKEEESMAVSRTRFATYANEFTLSKLGIEPIDIPTSRTLPIRDIDACSSDEETSLLPRGNTVGGL